MADKGRCRAQRIGKGQHPVKILRVLIDQALQGALIGAAQEAPQAKEAPRLLLSRRLR